MKKIMIIACMALFSTFAQAQSNEMELFQTMFNVEKKVMLMDFMKLSDVEATAFWPIYESFESERNALSTQKYKLVENYADSYETLTNERADELMKESFAIRASLEKVHKQYYGKISKALGAKRAAQFIQFERFVETTITAILYDNMPLIGEY